MELLAAVAATTFLETGGGHGIPSRLRAPPPLRPAVLLRRLPRLYGDGEPRHLVGVLVVERRGLGEEARQS